VVLDLPYEAIRQALSVQGRLHRSGLISVQQHYRNYLRGKLNLVSNQLADKLLVKTNDVMDLFVGTINKSQPAELTFVCFDLRLGWKKLIFHLKKVFQLIFTWKIEHIPLEFHDFQIKVTKALFFKLTYR
ncbi:MAG: Uncharacterized protein CEO40_265, partial [Parcubacteria group bacterium LiPW_72]